MTAELITSVASGYNKFTVVEIKSVVAYSDVERTDVYSGTRKKINSLDEKFPKINNAVFLANFFSSFFIDTQTSPSLSLAFCKFCFYTC